MIVLVGIAGCGKTTQGHILAERLNCPWVSTGHLLREHAGGEHAKQMQGGEILDDDMTISLLQSELIKLHPDKAELVLDGSPRTMVQARWLAGKFKSGEYMLTAVIHIKASKEVVKQRLLRRGRPDDHEPAINRRFLEYDETILPILDFLKNQGFKVCEIDGNGPVEADAKAIEQALGK